MHANSCEFERCDTPTSPLLATQSDARQNIDRRAWATLGAIIAVIAPLYPLLVFAHATFDKTDWPNNLWMIAYARAYFSAHHTFPAVYNVLGRVGIPQPIFYGPMLYPALALLSQPFGVDGAIRLAVIFIWAAQFGLIYRLARSLGAGTMHALAPATLAAWAIYPMTNLYNRGAIAEFMASALLCCAVAAGGSAFLHAAKSRRVAYGLLSALCAAEAIVAHGPTALMGAPILLLLYVVSFRIGLKNWKARLAATLGLILLGAALVGPWALVLKEFSSHLTIETPNNPRYPGAGHWQRFSTVDSWWARLKPLPIDDAWTAEAGRKSGTPYLDAQWNFPLVILAMWAVLRARKLTPLTLCAGIVSVGLLLLSVTPAWQESLPQRIGGSIQFPYRLVSGINLMALVMLLSAWRTCPPTRRDHLVLVLVLLWSAFGLGIKLSHAVNEVDPVGSSAAAAKDDYLVKLPGTFEGRLDYTVQKPDRAVAQIERSRAVTLSYAPLGLGPGEDAQEIKFSMAKPNWVITSILNFPWNRLILDGKAVPFDNVYNLAFHEAVYLPPGEHWIGYRFEPDASWVWATRISWLALTLTIGAVLMAFASRTKET